MNQDVFFAIGRTHRICQDYALSGVKNMLPFITVSDGCSSSKDTDFGSRFLCKGVEESIYNLEALSPIAELPAKLAYVSAKRIIRDWDLLPSEAFDATLIIAKVHEDCVRVIVSGDGVVAAKKKDGTIVSKTIEYKDNAPLYINYLFDNERKKLLLDTFDCTKTITTNFFGIGLSPIKEVSVNEIDVFDFQISEYSHVSIMTDGVLSFQRITESNTTKSSESVALEELLPDLMAYKGDAGTFVQRRCQKFMKQCGDNGIYHDDDFSIATISL